MFLCNATTTTEIYTLSLHDALPISTAVTRCSIFTSPPMATIRSRVISHICPGPRRGYWNSLMSVLMVEIGKHTSELQSRRDLVCRLLLEKKKKKRQNDI